MKVINTSIGVKNVSVPLHGVCDSVIDTLLLLQYSSRVPVDFVV